MKKSLANAYSIAKRLDPGKRIGDGEIKKPSLNEQGRLVELLRSRKKLASAQPEEPADDESLLDLNEDALEESPEDASPMEDPIDEEDDRGDLSARARKRMKARK